MKKLRFILFCFCLSALLFACNEPEEKTPEGILSEEKMADVLVSMHLSESIHNFYITQTKGGNKEIQFNVFAEHQISHDTYYKSVTYYSHRPEKMKSIFEQVMEKLNVMKTIEGIKSE